mgnify:CR=1 FL=1|tara:strand:- start:2853 stop:3560 length:708 start_codon:yes stop_codon:yes gene_type:complete
MKTTKLSIVVPCYNEAKNIPLILDRFNDIINRNDIEIILVNNGSSDNSQQVMDELVPKFTFSRAINVAVNQGYGYGIVSGLKVATGEFIGYTHADMQANPSDVLKALEIIEKQQDPNNCYVKGDRKGRPLFDQLFTIGMSAFESLYLGTRLWDINAQPNVFHNSLFKELENTPNDFSLDLYFLYKAQIKDLNIIRFNVVFPERIHGESSWNTGLSAKWKFIKRTIKFSLKLKKQL